ncbi:basic proline-rich protein-like [Poecilia reticulata]|uniref:basic proline-rich protein-like n=1 Tax=Poecilia reticulata TaxID=8081 RepID=UPI0007E9CF65|nr:PREDICTED: basic proline-rich protein-like [Poecilia reticulata]
MLMGNDDVTKQKVSSHQKPEGCRTWTHQNLNGPGQPDPLGPCPPHAHSPARSRPGPRRAVRVPVLQVVTPPPPFSTIPAAPVRSGPSCPGPLCRPAPGCPASWPGEGLPLRPQICADPSADL